MDDDGNARHRRGWRFPGNGRRRWLEPFVLLLIAEGMTHGYGITAGLGSMGVAGRGLDVGQIYRVLRNLESEGSVASTWSTGSGGPARREYQLTEAGRRALAEWGEVMQERRRLANEFIERLAGQHVPAVGREQRPAPVRNDAPGQ